MPHLHQHLIVTALLAASLSFLAFAASFADAPRSEMIVLSVTAR